MAKVLICDDSRFQVEVLASALKGKGLELAFGYDALQSWMAAVRLVPNLILLDINMPAGTGVEVLKRLRMSNKTQHIPVIVISGETNAGTESAARDLGVVEFLHKPVEAAQLCASVDRALGVCAHAELSHKVT